MTKHKTEEFTVDAQAAPTETTLVPSQEPAVAVNLTDDLTAESLPDLSEYADEPGGPLPRGWYPAEAVEGYATRSGKEKFTEDVVAKDGGSRNLRVCFAVQTGGKDVRNLQSQFNYRRNDFSADRLKFVLAMREEMKGVRNWPDRDAQRSSLALAKLGQFQKAGAKLEFIGEAVKTINLIGGKYDVYVSIDSNGYNEITQYAKAGTVTRAPRNKA